VRFRAPKSFGVNIAVKNPRSFLSVLKENGILHMNVVTQNEFECLRCYEKLHFLLLFDLKVPIFFPVGIFIGYA
jgi:hypothetical protein